MTSNTLSVRTSDTAATPATVGEDAHTCPECDTRAVQDGDERVCPDCGLIVQEDRLDRGPEWVRTDAGEDSHRRTGPVATEGLHDRGLSTKLWGRVDANGNAISSKKRQQLSRMKRLHNQSRFESKRERNCGRAIGEIGRMGSALGMARDRREQAVRLWRSAQDANLIMGRSIEGMASAAIFAVARIHEMAIFLRDVAAVSRVGGGRIETAYDVLNRELGLPTPPPRPVAYVGMIASEVDCSTEVRRLADELAKRYPEEYPSKAVHPGGVAGGPIYLINQRHGDGLTQETICDVADVTPVSLRDRINELEEVALDGV